LGSPFSFSNVVSVDFAGFVGFGDSFLGKLGKRRDFFFESLFGAAIVK